MDPAPSEMMRRIRNLAVSLAFTLGLGLTQTGAEEKSATGTVRQVRQLYGKIRAQEPLSVSKLPFHVAKGPMEGQAIRYDYEDGLLAVAITHAGGEHGAAEEHFYYQDGRIFFILVKESHWVFTGEQGSDGLPETKGTLTEFRYYVNGKGECVQALRKQVESIKQVRLDELIEHQANENIEPGPHFKRALQKGKGLFLAETSREVSRFLEIFYFGD